MRPTVYPMQRIIFLNRFFFPDQSATSQLVTDLACQMSTVGYETQSITSTQLFDDPEAILAGEDFVSGVHVVRIRSTHFGRKQLFGRGMDYLSYFAGCYRVLLSHLRPEDIVIAKTDPPLLSIVAAAAARKRNAKLVTWLQDLYPEVATELGVAPLNGRINRILQNLRDKSLHAANMNVVVGERMGRRLQDSGIPHSKITVIPNWSNDEDIVPIKASENPMRRELGLSDKFVVGYSGNLGRAHEFQTILSAASQLSGYQHIVFLFIGGGHSFESLSRAVGESNLNTMFRFLPYQQRDQLKYSLAIPDAHLLSLRPELEGLVVPSKFYGIAAAGRPILAIVARDGEFAPIIEQHRCGVVIEPTNGRALADTILNLSKDPDELEAMGARARDMLEKHFSRRQALSRWRSLLEAVEASSVA